MNEKKTKRIIIDFLRTNTTMEIHDRGSWFYALHFENSDYEYVAYRADMDAIIGAGCKPFHGCGHDGHCATLCRIALETENCLKGKNIILIFQPAEENGKGAAIIAPELRSLGISRIYGFHNIPGEEEGVVLLRAGTFACASKGITMRFHGKQAHAAYPETGINPAFAIAQTVSESELLNDKKLYSALAFATIVNIKTGQPNAFGVSAGEGELSVTIRAELESDLALLQEGIMSAAQNACKKYGVALETEFFDEFPQTYNDEKQIKRAQEIFEKENIKYKLLTEPMRWSEDFGYYLKDTDGMFMGIGAGLEHAPLHTDSYEYNTDIITNSAKVLLMLL